MKSVVAFVSLVVQLLAGFALAQAPLQAVPEYSAHITDVAKVLPEAERSSLEKQLTAFEAEHGAQIGVLIIDTTGQEDITDYTQRVGDRWKLGRQGVGDGLLLVVAVKDHRVRIAPYRALEPAIPDVLAKRIIDTQMVPAFRQGNYASGLREALLSLQKAIVGGGEVVLANPETFQDKWLSQIKQWLGLGAFQLSMALIAFFALSRLRQFLTLFVSGRPASLVTAALAGGVSWLLTASVLITAGFVVLGYFSKFRFVNQGRHGNRGRFGRPSSADVGEDLGSVARSGGGGDSAGGGASGRW